MEVEIHNFRCWKKKTVKINDKGLILISGGSGSGKSSILNSIFFAITGQGSKIVTYNEKKCSVKLTFDEGPIMSILRTKNPGRLVVVLRENSNILEDEEGQKYIDSVFGNHFQQTSYMTQKMIHSFLNLSPSEKMNFLQKFVLDDTTIQNMKKKCKETISQLKQKLTETRGKYQVFTSENDILENDDIVKNKPEINDEILNYSPVVLKQLKTKYDKLNNEIITFHKYSIQQKEFLKNIEEYNNSNIELTEKKKELETTLQTVEYKGDEYIKQLENEKLNIKKQNEYKQLSEKLNIEEENLGQFILEQTSFYENEKNKINEQYETVCKIIKKVFDIEHVSKYIEQWKKDHRILNEFLEIQKQIVEQKLIETTSVDLDKENEIELLQNKIKEKQQTILEYKQNWKLSTQVYKCPSCSSKLCFSTDKSSSIENSSKNIEQKSSLIIFQRITDLSEEEYKQNIFKFQNEEKEMTNALETLKNIVSELKTKKREFELLCNKSQKLKQQIKDIDSILLKYIEFDTKPQLFSTSSDFSTLNSIEKTQQTMNKKMEKLVKKMDEYTSSKTTLENLNMKIEEIKSSSSANPTILQKKRTIDKLKQDLKNIERIFSKIQEKANREESDIDTELNTQIKKKHEYENIKTKINDTEKDLVIINKKIEKTTTELKPITKYLESNFNIIDEIGIVKEEIQKNTLLEEKHNIFINYEKTFNQLKRIKNELRILDYIINTTSREIVLQETFLNKISEAESISLTKCIDSVNYYINDYLEKFFQNDSIIVDIVPFKDTKKDIKPVINIKVCYKGEEVELSSLSGGEYDRVSLAIMLSFNHICKSDMILLDESIASLDAELTSDILEKLKENLVNKRVIVVAHQISTGVFDQIIHTS